MEESNPWPTFVDAFSTVLCIFIFLMLVFVLNSMLIMYESSKKRYEAPLLAEQTVQPVASSVSGSGSSSGAVSTTPNQTLTGDQTQPVEATAADDNKNRSQDAEADMLAASSASASASTDAGAATGADFATASDSTAASAASPADESEQAGREDKKSDVIRLADNQTATSIKGQTSGQFDTSKANPSWETQGNQFIVHFKSMEQGYPQEIIDEMAKWFGKDKPVSIVVYAYVSPSIAISDAMRLAYERGVILLKVVKSKYPNTEVSISVVNDATTLTNSAVITKSE
ncbi:MAG: hypothetical protein KIB03_11300 [Citrobacter freundii]|nr:hypothetical protein [Citrobacter freundii]MBY6251715.1 hypothetical protein [Citrobacter werkmanii]NBD84221.1 hypothetical protein [Citrobacter werkmanii]ORT71991.1 hypothetical protein BO998_19535 [Citrobacter werkmanii]OSP20605.1 hypothetical protein B6S66_04205 [Citrobacter werkmanii]